MSFGSGAACFLPAFLRPLEGEAAIQYEKEGLPVESLNLRQIRFDTLSRLLKIVRLNRIEIIHWNFYYPFNNYLWFLSLLAPWVKHYYTDHNSRQKENLNSGRAMGLKPLLKRLLASRYEKTFCVSDFVLTQLERSQWPNLRKLNNFINTERFKPDSFARREVRRSLGVADEFVALIVAWLIKDKGVDVALNALAGMPQNLVLWVVGEGPERKNLQGLAEDLDLGIRVQFLDPRDHVEPLIQAADCFICPSLWAEAAGLVNQELLASGLPVLASRIGGNPEFVEDGRIGYLYTPGDDQELGDRLRSIAGDESIRQRMSQQARSLAVERYSTQSLIEEHISQYQDVDQVRY
jgi:glycosyltransferase involved in cell wall biosynthesis